MAQSTIRGTPGRTLFGGLLLIDSPQAATRNSTRGQGLAEFAISATVLLLLLLSILQFAFLYNAQIGVMNSVRDAARYGSSLTANTDATATTAAGLTSAFLASTLASHVTPFSASRVASASSCFEQYPDAGATPAVRVRVTVAYDHPLVVPLIGAIIDGFDGSFDGSFRMTSMIEIRVDNPADPVPALTLSPCA